MAKGIWQPDTSFVNVYCGQGFLYCTMDEQEGQNQPIHSIGVQADGEGVGGGLQLYYMIKPHFKLRFEYILNFHHKPCYAKTHD